MGQSTSVFSFGQKVVLKRMDTEGGERRAVLLLGTIEFLENKYSLMLKDR